VVVVGLKEFRASLGPRGGGNVKKNSGCQYFGTPTFCNQKFVHL